MSGKKLALGGAALAALVVFGWLAVREPRVVPQAPDEGAALARQESPLPSRPGDEAVPAPGAPRQAAPPVPPAAVRVLVVGEDGEPLARSTVRALWGVDAREEGKAYRRRGPAELVEARGIGEFACARIHGPIVVLLAAAPLYLAQVRTLEVPAAGLPEPVTLRLEPAETGRFCLIDPLSDRPVAGARAGPIAPDPWRGPENPESGQPPRNLDGQARVERLYEVESDSRGELSLPVQPGTVQPGTIWITSEGYGPTALQFFGGRLQDPHASSIVPMFPPTRLRIAVRREGGEHVAGFRYSLTEAGSEAPPEAFQNIVEGSDTVHELYHLCRLGTPPAHFPEYITLGVSSGELEARRTFPVRYGEENPVEVFLESQSHPTSLAGQVLGPTGLPVEGARVVAFNSEGRASVVDDRIREAGSKWSFETGADGRYEFIFPDHPGPVYLLVEHPEHPFHVSELLKLGRGQRRAHDVRLPAPAVLICRLAGGAGRREGVDVELTNETSAARQPVTYYRAVRTDEEGRAVFSRVHAGSWAVRWVEDSLYRQLPLHLRSGRSYELVLGKRDPAGGMELRGVLVAGGRPAGELNLSLRSRETNDTIGNATTDAQGAFLFTGVPSGRHCLVVLHGPDFPTRFLAVDAREGAGPLVIDLTATTLTGRVLGASGPLAGVSVKPYTRQAIGVEEAMMLSFHGAQTDAEGHYRLAGLYQMPTVLVFEKDGYIPRRVRWVPSGALEAGLEDVRLERAPEEGTGGVRLRVIDRETGAEVPSAEVLVSALEAEGSLRVANLGRTAPDDELVAKALPSGRYRAFVRSYTPLRQQYTIEEVEFSHAGGAEQEVEVVCRPAGTVILELGSEDGRVPAAATVEVLGEDGLPLLNWRGTRKLRFTGSTPLVGLPFENLIARVTAAGWKTLEFPLTPAPDRAARVVKVMERE